MGACDFRHRVLKSKVKDAEEAFHALRDEAWSDIQCDLEDGEEYEGYSGTIYEVRGFKMMTLPPGYPDPGKFIDDLMTGAVSSRFNPFEDKWGECGCIDGGQSYWFFGMASS
jgi:hypothetical protein